MRLATAARRTVATVAATALVTTGGVVSGVLTGVANAEVLQSVTPASASNTGVVSIDLKSSGTQFYPSGDFDQNRVILRKVTPATGQDDIVGTDYETPEGCDSILPGVPAPDDSCGTVLRFKADLTNAAPGNYQVIATSTALIPANDTHEFTFSPFVVVAPFAPKVTATALDPITAEGQTTPADGQLTLTGTDLNKGTKIEFVVPGATPDSFDLDPKITFTPTSYVSRTQLKGTYAAVPGFVPGLHKIRATNTADQSTVSDVSFFQPSVASTNPDPIHIGQGATERPVTLTGPVLKTFAPGSTVFINTTGTPTASPDVTADDVVVSADGKTLSFTLNATGAAVVGKRNLTVRGPDGGFTRLGDAITVNAAPSVTSISPNQRGQGSTTVPDGASPAVITVTGTGLTPTTTFDFGPGVTATTVGSSGPTNATIELVIAPDATTGARSVTASNADGGTKTTANVLTVTAKPVIATLDPASNVQGSSGSMTLTGTGFVPGASLKASGNGVTFGATSGNSSVLTTTYTIAADAPLGARSLTITNPDGGTSTCVDCFGVNSLIATGGPVFNTGPANIKLKPAPGQPALTAQTVVTFTLPSATDQGALPGTFVSLDPDGTLTVSAPFTKAAVGRYNVETKTGNTELICVGCIRVAADKAPKDIAVEPNTGGQGALSRTLTVTGSEGIYPGQTVVFGGTGITTKSTTYQAPNTLKVVIDIAENAAPGARTVTVRNVGDPAINGTGPGTFTVVVGPVTTEVTPDSVGQGASSFPATLTGTGYQEGATVLVSGGKVTAVVPEGAEVTATSLPVVLTVDGDAAVGARDVTVVNPDGGRSTLTSAIEVTPAPTVTSITPNKLPQNAGPVPVTINGTGFQKTESAQAVVTVSGLTFTEMAVNEGGTAITGKVKVAPNAPDGKRAVVVTNPDGGRFSLLEGFEVATPPSPPTAFRIVNGDGFFKAYWSGAASRPGTSPISGYAAQLYTANGQPIGSPQFTSGPAAHFGGLTNGTLYKVRVAAKNAAGYGELSTVVGNGQPRFGTRLTSAVSPRTATSGNVVTYGGRLSRLNNTAVSGGTIVLALRPAVGATTTVQVPTRSDGTWTYRHRPTYNTTVTTRFVGNTLNAPSTAPSYSLPVATRVVVTSPASGSSSRATTVLTITGKVSPNKAGRTIGLYRLYSTGYKGIASATIASNGTYTIRVRLPKGTFTLRTGVAAFGGNATGFSPAFVVKRT